jgi:hypothetical protein
VSIPEFAIVSEVFIMENFCGKLGGLLFFGEPVDISVFRTMNKKLPKFLTCTADLQELQNIFHNNIGSTIIILSPINRKLQANSQTFFCPISNRRVQVAPEIVTNFERVNQNLIVDCLNILVLLDHEPPQVQDHTLQSEDQYHSQRAKQIEDAYVEYVKLLMKSIEQGKYYEEIIESNLVIPKFRACLESSGLILTERMMKYIINLIRSLKTPALVIQAFNDLILNPYILKRVDRKAKELYQDFLCIYYPQLICMPLFEKYLAKRILLIEVVDIY